MLTSDYTVKEELYKNLAESVNAILWEYDIEDDKWNYVSPQTKRILGFSPQEWTNLDFWVRHIHKEDREKTKSYCLKCTEKGKDHRFEYRFQKKSGDFIWIRDEVTVIKKNNSPVKIRGFMIDITKKKKLESEIKQLTFKDYLTGLYNRRYLDNEIERLNNSRKYPVSIIVGDLDNLKIVNDNYGHKVGDQYLKKAANIFKQTLRTEDIITRTGGDEFVVLLPETDEDTTKNICERIEYNFVFINKDVELPEELTISLGFATASNKMDINRVYKQADLNMYKNKGKR